MTAPICQLKLAIDGKIDVFKATNPWGSGDEDEPKPLDEPMDAEHAARKLQAMFRERADEDKRRRGK